MCPARSTHISQCATGFVIVRQARNRSITVAARNGCEFEVAQGIAGEKGVAKSRDTARRSARANGGGAWVRFFIFWLSLRGFDAFGRRCYLDASVWFRWFWRLRFGFLLLGFGGFLLQLAEGAVGALVHARETGFIAVTQSERSGFLG